MFWLGGFLSLDLTTATPDALCPPLEEARAAVKARVGEVRGDYRAEFALIRADDGRQGLDLVLREGEKEVLHRELPLDAAGCQDAAQTIALVLERYFDAIEPPTPVEPAPTPILESVPGSAATAEPPRDDGTSRAPTREKSSISQVGARAGFLYDREFGMAAVVGASFYPAALQLTPSLRWGAALEVAPFFSRQTETIRERRIEAFLLQGAFAVPLLWSHSRWRTAFGPWVQLRLQRADAPSLENEQSAYRVLPGVGGFARVGVELTPSFGLSAGVAGGPQLRNAASRFVLEGGAGQIAVLVPHAWFIQGQLTLELKL